MVAAVSIPAFIDAHEQRFLVHNVPWKIYVLLREAIDEPGLRMTYLEGSLEFTSPSRAHERNKKTIARLVEAYALLMRLPLIGYGSTTFRKEAKERGAEPDECWCVGHQMRDGEFPDVVMEVIELAPFLDKLRIYDGFEVPEVWLFEKGTFAIYKRRKSGGYARIAKSRFLPTLDLRMIARYAVREDQDVALQEFADEIARKTSKVKQQKKRRR